MENITVVDFSDGKANKTVTNAPYQWSYGQILRITGLELPDSTNPYMTGDKVTHNGSTWVSTCDNNVWEPGVYGWETV